ncbi:MAG: sodium:calcium antiporter, partial [Planctomycetota bacterium]|nr:sodium:calcium antiporter [Planctomycetota bacterium]
MAIEILLLIIGLALLYFGGEWLITGSVTLARKLGVAPLIVGLTVVAFGTSAPELFVNTRAALSGHGEISFGNIFGSNIANIALILGLCAIVRPMAVHKQLVRKTIPMLLAFTGLAIFM